MDDQRLDKWLWCARFYKTRSLAQEAINAGHVTAGGVRAKPSRTVAPGLEIEIRRPPFEMRVEVLGLAAQRLSAPLAQALYREYEDSRLKREALAEQLRLVAAGERYTPGKPDRRDRRELGAFKRGLRELPAED
jgi:ribosome-associated heat shock protein Hsp15